MSLLSFKVKGNFNNTKKFFKKALSDSELKIIEKYAIEGTKNLVENTPKDTGLTSASWYYEIKKTNTGISIIWSNTNIKDGVNIAVILQYGHGTRYGAYVRGIDYINPALQPVFDKMADELWMEVTK